MIGLRSPGFALPVAILGTACLSGNAYGQLSIGWESQFGALQGASTQANGVSATPDGIYVAGTTHGLLSQTYYGSYDAFLRKYDLNGNEVWTRQFGSPDFDWGNGVSAGT